MTGQRYHGEETGSDDEKEALEMAASMLTRGDFEGDSVRVIARDGELVKEFYVVS